jgi:uncharacterized membrane protein YraQ (UPF0718 family)
LTSHVAPVRQRNLIAAGAVLVAVLALLTWAKWLPYFDKVPKVAGAQTLGPSFVTGVSGPPGPSLAAGLHYAAKYFAAIWPALVAGLLIAAAVEAALPGLGLPSVLRRDTRRAGALGGLLALPAMMCTCCAAPIAVGLRRRGASPGTALAFLLASPALNPVVLAFCVFVLPWQWASLRAITGLLLVGGVIALARRLPEMTREEPEQARSPVSGRPQARRPGSRFAIALTRLSLRIVPLHVALVIALGAARGWLLPMAGGLGATAITVFVVAVGATLLPIPTAGEVAIVATLLSSGFDSAIAGAALITLPAVSLPSLLIVGRSFPARVLAAAGVGVIALGLVTALTVHTLGL